MLNNGEIFSHRFTPHTYSIWQKIQLLAIEEPLTIAWIAKIQKLVIGKENFVKNSPT
jgi:hypothetical protein